MILVKNASIVKEFKREDIGFITWSFFHIVAHKIPENPSE